MNWEREVREPTWWCEGSCWLDGEAKSVCILWFMEAELC